MLIRIYADDARRIAEAYELKDLVETDKATWMEPELRYHLEADVVLVKMRIGGSTRNRIHHYFLLAPNGSTPFALELIQTHCNKSRCYYVMPGLFTGVTKNKKR